MKKALDQILFHIIIFVIWGLLNTMKHFDHRLRKSLSKFKATYQFCCGLHVFQLIFNNGKISIKRGHTDASDFQLTFIDISGAIKVVKEHPGDMIRLLLENKIHKKGNIYYLFQFGYFFGCCDRYFQELLSKFSSKKKARVEVS